MGQTRKDEREPRPPLPDEAQLPSIHDQDFCAGPPSRHRFGRLTLLLILLIIYLVALLTFMGQGA